MDLKLTLAMVMLDEDEEGTALPMPTPIKPSEKPAKTAGMLSDEGGATSSLVPSPPGTQLTSPDFAARQSLSRQTTLPMQTPGPIESSEKSAEAAGMPSDEGGATSSLVPSPPGTQLTAPDFAARQSLSRQTTLTTTASFSSLSSEDVAGMQNNVKLSRILSVTQEIVFECRICWVSRTKSAPHKTYRCSEGTCSGEDWVRFKSSIPFPLGKVCFFCFAPFSDPFNHRRAPTGSRQSPAECDYPDVLKELTYIIYQDASLRQSVFAKLKCSTPSSLNEFKQFITGRQSGGILGVYEVIFAYIGIREEEMTSY